LITCTGTIVHTGKTSIEVRVKVDTEDIRSSFSKSRALEAFFTFVALDRNGRPTDIPPFTPETEREKELYEYVEQRRKFDSERREAAKARAENKEV
jgi:acyl-CoA hydrolase